MEDFYITQIYQQLTNHTFDEAVLIFEQLKVESNNTGDLYFQSFGVPNIIERPDYAFERLACYEKLLTLLWEKDNKKFLQIHKGTPYYFLAWLCFDISNFEKALYYLNLALSEDQKNMPRGWLTTPGTNALLLKTDGCGPVRRVVEKVRADLEVQIARFNQDSDSNIILDKLALNLLTDLCKPGNEEQSNSIFTALYTFIYEYESTRKQILLGNSTASLESLVSNLFKGTLVFESLLKHLYVDKTSNKKNGFLTLEKVLRLPKVKSDFELGNINLAATSISELELGKLDNSISAFFVTTGKVRNFTGHDLAREGELNKIENYEYLFKRVLYSIFFVLKKHYS